ncbi:MULTISPECIES: enolase C-terminal domain-like protein [unclassified Streptomyces]|uniref:enolase C-terminal domain-like protein n=1 Tax=unclassified Streptomyces TaxID=2593676 RepID=UPI002E7720ED|nr:enolase C-terminal domain-like protein [Streptomyces sp. JV176]MEE1803124.1 enolase C-terminal domain-like protein [Streptomyces sp. JV176]
MTTDATASGSPRITEVRLTPILIADAPLLNIAGVHQPYAPRLIVEIVTEAGTVGLGETYGDGAYLDLAARLAPHLTGLPVGGVNAIRAVGRETGRRVIDSHPDASGYRGLLTAEKMRLSIVSAFETAALDAYGRELGVPVHALLGGKVRDRVEYAAYLFHKWGRHPGADDPTDDWGEVVDPDGVVALARLFQERCGSRSFKLKGGAFPPDQEVAAVRALADAFPGHPLRLDPNGAWSLKTSLRVAEELTGVVQYLEDPTARLEDMAEVHRRTGMPLATNMVVTATEEIAPAFAADAVQIVLSDHHFWGGLLATRDLAAVCDAHGRALSMHSNTHLGISLAAMTQVAATLTRLDHSCDTHYPWQSEDVITEPLTFQDGAVAVTDTPGLGVELDRDALARLHERWNRRPDLRERDDIAAMRAVHPDHRRPTLPKF